jgi:hypothetical protein
MWQSYLSGVVMKHIMAVLMLLILMAGCAPAGSTAPTQPQTQVAVDNKSTQIMSDAADPIDNTTAQVAPIAPSQSIPLQGIPVTLRHDYLNSEENLFTQVAIWHPYTTFFCPPMGMGIAGNFVESPLIILPNKEGSVCLLRNDSGDYKYLPLYGKYYPCTTSYDVTADENLELSKPGWGLATAFHPVNTPFSIKNIKIAGVANYTTGIMDDYDNKHIVVNILNDKSEVIWSKYCKWRDLRNIEGTTRLPSAVWRDIAVDNVTVDGDFTVDVLALSHTYNEFSEAYDYFSIAYEKLMQSGNATNSFISRNGQRSSPYIGLYDQYGDPVSFNLCIRVEGIY